MIIKRAKVKGIKVVLKESLSSDRLHNIFIQARLKDFADNDPAVMEQMVQETKDALEATNRNSDTEEDKLGQNIGKTC